MLIVGFCRMEENAHETGIFLRNGLLCHFCGIKKPEIEYGRFGKPMLNDPEIGFSVSHSGELVVCAVNLPTKRVRNVEFSGLPAEWNVEILPDSDGGAIGADVERVRPEMKEDSMRRISKKYFSEKEKIRMENAVDPAEEFFRIWTAKESFCKWTGNGLADLAKLDSCRLPENVELVTRMVQDKSGVYALSICMGKKEERRGLKKGEPLT